MPPSRHPPPTAPTHMPSPPQPPPPPLPTTTYASNAIHQQSASTATRHCHLNYHHHHCYRPPPMPAPPPPHQPDRLSHLPTPSCCTRHATATTPPPHPTDPVPPNRPRPAARATPPQQHHHPRTPPTPSRPTALARPRSSSISSFMSVPIVGYDADSVSDDPVPELETVPDLAPIGFIFNNLDSRLFYPIYVANPAYEEDRSQSRTILAKWIKYDPDYTQVHGTLGRNNTIRSVPVHVGRRARNYGLMTEAKWRKLLRGADEEFAINEALTEIGDPRLTGEVNQLRGQSTVKDTLEGLLRDAHHRVTEITLEFPVRHDEERTRRIRCFGCKTYGHRVQDCIKRKKNHRRKEKNTPSPRVSSTIDHEECNDNKMTLLEHIALLDWEDWTPESHDLDLYVTGLGSLDFKHLQHIANLLP
ncbi:hypothetical protein EDB89DRAFT_1909022 [Lactarius sanguifluus]|nr:hypothetical protein EDB89DRAFT_1909022 [Lactarius sanguifluus]